MVVFLSPKWMGGCGKGSQESPDLRRAQVSLQRVELGSKRLLLQGGTEGRPDGGRPLPIKTTPKYCHENKRIV